MRTTAIWITSVGLMLAACQSAPRTADRAAPSPEQSAAAGQPTQQARTTPTPQPVRRRPPASPIAPEKIKARLMGLYDAEVTALFGPPAFTRRDKPAEIWQYRDGSCILDVFLYETGSTHVVKHVDIRSTSENDLKAGYCFADKFSASDPIRRG